MVVQVYLCVSVSLRMCALMLPSLMVWSSAQPLQNVTVLVLRHSLVVPYQTTVVVLRVYFHWYS